MHLFQLQDKPSPEDFLWVKWSEWRINRISQHYSAKVKLLLLWGHGSFCTTPSKISSINRWMWDCRNGFCSQQREKALHFFLFPTKAGKLLPDCIYSQPWLDYYLWSGFFFEVCFQRVLTRRRHICDSQTSNRILPPLFLPCTTAKYFWKYLIKSTKKSSVHLCLLPISLAAWVSPCMFRRGNKRCSPSVLPKDHWPELSGMQNSLSWFTHKRLG